MVPHGRELRESKWEERLSLLTVREGRYKPRILQSDLHLFLFFRLEYTLRATHGLWRISPPGAFSKYFSIDSVSAVLIANLLGVFRFDRFRWGFDGLFIVDGEEQELAEGVAAVKALAGDRAVPVSALGKPELQGLIAEAHGTVFDELVIAQETDFGSRARYVRFHGEDLRSAHIDPGASLKPDINETVPHVVGEHAAGTVGALTKMHDPGCPAVPGALTFALKFIPGLQIGVKNESQRGKADRGDVPWKFLDGHRAVAVFLHVEIGLINLTDLDEVVEFVGLAGGFQSHGAEIGMFDLFGGGETIDILDEFTDATGGSVEHLIELARGSGVEV